MCCQLKTNRSSEQGRETGGGLFLTDCFLFRLGGCGGRGVCCCGGGCGGCGGCRRGDSCACDGLLNVNSLERSDQCFDLGCVSLDSSGSQDGLDGVLGDVLAGRVENHSAVDILHLIQLLLFSRIMH